MDQRVNNQILRQLDPDTLGQIERHCNRIDLRQGDILGVPLRPMQTVYFPLGAVASVVVDLSDGRMTEAAMIGRDGVVGAGEALSEIPLFNRVVVQVSGAALTLSADRFRELHGAHKAFRRVIGRYRQVYVAQAQQSAACNANHDIEARLCRWLLRVRDLAGDQFLLTQEIIAEMLGVQRASVSSAAHGLQKAGLIEYRRGHIQVTDASGLEEAACECYMAIKGYERTAFGAQRAIAEPPHQHEPVD